LGIDYCESHIADIPASGWIGFDFCDLGALWPALRRVLTVSFCWWMCFMAHLGDCAIQKLSF